MAQYHFHHTWRFIHSQPVRTKLNWKSQLHNGANSNLKETHFKEAFGNLQHNPVVILPDDPDPDAYYASLLQTCTSNRALAQGYSQNGQNSEALELFRQMQMTGVKLNSVTIVSVLPACTHSAALQQVKSIHGYIIRTGIVVDAFVGSALISMFAKFGSLKISRIVFEGISQKALVLWNSLIGGYVQNGHVDVSLNLFQQMQLQGLKPNPCTVVSFLPVCASLENLHHGKEGMCRMDT